MTTGFALCDENGAILWCNRHMTGDVGYKLRELQGCQWHKLLAGTDTDEQVRPASMRHSRICCVRGVMDGALLVSMQDVSPMM